MAAVPFEFIDRTSLLGTPERIADRLVAYAEAGVTTLTVAPYPPAGVTEPAQILDHAIRTLRVLAEALERAGVGA
jgi:alkanesulfonate monooxygenase SsuD/methylene tetrahydromethanopterin reductase-like flavin-dependent oxidoreductase (luciferase family)